MYGTVLGAASCSIRLALSFAWTICLVAGFPRSSLSVACCMCSDVDRHKSLAGTYKAVDRPKSCKACVACFSGTMDAL